MYVIVEIFVRGVTADALMLDFNDVCDVLWVMIDVLSGGDVYVKMYDLYILELKFFGVVDCESGVVNVSSVKVEIRMKKKIFGYWNDFEWWLGGGLLILLVNVYSEVKL